ncbi:hypothetical protein BDV96DRAFT_583408 [Lophiotrema nucula]|uniref:Uncharacterized protein n=1 Tax=Lophiotrema nucula TaxID=690887 RepID=A0A6A5YUY2_9PLEO|nr:hypothetical protein BDV96DRAFT_583408 [Lophiotrema nucula]
MVIETYPFLASALHDWRAAGLLPLAEQKVLPLSLPLSIHAMPPTPDPHAHRAGHQVI